MFFQNAYFTIDRYSDSKVLAYRKSDNWFPDVIAYFLYLHILTDSCTIILLCSTDFSNSGILDIISLHLRCRC
jgi:hypothetical protein